MRINKVELKNIVEVYSKTTSVTPRTDNKKETADEVVLTTNGQEILQLKKKLAEIPEMREELVQKIKAKILAGEYVLDSEKLAAKLKEWGEF